MNRRKIVAICGSTRQNSTNHHLIKAISNLCDDTLDITTSQPIEQLPHFNPDNNIDFVPGSVVAFRRQLKDADGILICTPEYAHGVPGTLKNAIDWTVSSSEFSHKPTVLITASTDGRYGHQALLETLRVIEAKNIEKLQMIIQFAQSKISKDSKITDEKTVQEIKTILTNFIETLDEEYVE